MIRIVKWPGRDINAHTIAQMRNAWSELTHNQSVSVHPVASLPVQTVESAHAMCDAGILQLFDF